MLRIARVEANITTACQRRGRTEFKRIRFVFIWLFVVLEGVVAGNKRSMESVKIIVFQNKVQGTGAVRFESWARFQTRRNRFMEMNSAWPSQKLAAAPAAP